MSSTMTAEISQLELDELRATVRAFLAEKSGPERLREVIESEDGYDPALWRELAQQIGLQALALPTEYGGDGYGFNALTVVLEEMGRALLPSPFLSSVVFAGFALEASGDPEAQAAHLPGIAAGTTTATLAVAEDDGAWIVDGLATTAHRVDDGSWILNGQKSFVIDGASADLILVVASGEEGPTLFAVSGDAPGLERTALRTLDLTRRQARLELADVPAVLVGQPGGAGDIVAKVLDAGMAALAAEQAGGARACLEASAEYARERVQFGRQIGSFQAVKHKCADMLVRVQLAEATSREAADALSGVEGAADAAEAVAVAHAVCSESYMFVAAENIQVHGGIGFTWEHPAHLYFRRAKASQLFFGGPAVYYGRILDRIGLLADD